MNENAVQQYEQYISELREIITNFQKGNMPLKQAVDKYKQSEHLIKTCQDTLQTFESITQSEQTYDISQNTLSFEDKLSRLQNIIQIIDNTSDLPLHQLLAFIQESKQLICFCQKELQDFQHLIEYHQNN